MKENSEKFVYNAIKIERFEYFPSLRRSEINSTWRAFSIPVPCIGEAPLRQIYRYLLDIKQMIWTKPLAWFLVGSSGLPLVAPVTSECIPYRDVCYTTFPNARMDITSLRRKRQDSADIYSRRNASMLDNTYLNENGNTKSSEGDNEGKKKKSNTTRMSALEFMIRLMEEAKNLEPANKAEYYNTNWASYVNSVEKYVNSLEKKLVHQGTKIITLKGQIITLKGQILTLEDTIKAKDLELFKLSLPVKLNNEFDRFIELHGYDINLTQEETLQMNKISGKNEKVQFRLTKTCEHIITDLHKTDPLIQDLYKEMNLVDYQNMKTLTETERIKAVCNALVSLKFDRNAKIRKVFIDGPKITKIQLFSNEKWNEALAAFMNGHRTGIIDSVTVEYEDSSTKVPKTEK